MKIHVTIEVSDAAALLAVLRIIDTVNPDRIRVEPRRCVEDTPPARNWSPIDHRRLMRNLGRTSHPLF